MWLWWAGGRQPQAQGEETEVSPGVASAQVLRLGAFPSPVAAHSALSWGGVT